LREQSSTRGDCAWKEIGHTETLKDNLDPFFTTPIAIDFRFQETQKLQFQVFDVDKARCTGGNIGGDLLGLFHCTLGQVVGSPGRTLIGNLEGPKQKGKIKIFAEECVEMKSQIYFNLRGVKLANRDGWFGTSDPYLVFKRRRPDGSFKQVLRTETVRDNLNPQWKPFQIPLHRLCQGNMEELVYIDCNDQDDNGKFDEIGHVEVTVRQLLSSPILKLLHPRGKVKSVGTIESVSPTKIIEVPTFIDYLAGGLELHLLVAIDFTASNGNPRDRNSLHYNNQSNPEHQNPYEQAIRAVASILMPYSRTGKIMPLGYGGHINNQVNHCFTLCNNGDHFVHSVEGLLHAYNEALVTVALSGPTYFHQVIEYAMKVASSFKDDSSQQKYMLLLIITDGVIMDMNETISALVQASNLPVSVVIVGVGNADFSQMEELDGDGKALCCPFTHKVAKRDIVQFVAMQKYHQCNANSMERLTADVLGEIPSQVVAYYKSMNILPLPPVPPPVTTI